MSVSNVRAAGCLRSPVPGSGHPPLIPFWFFAPLQRVEINDPVDEPLLGEDMGLPASRDCSPDLGPVIYPQPCRVAPPCLLRVSGLLRNLAV